MIHKNIPLRKTPRYTLKHTAPHFTAPHFKTAKPTVSRRLRARGIGIIRILTGWCVCVFGFMTVASAQQLALSATARDDTVGMRFAVRELSLAGWTVGAQLAAREVVAGQLEASRRTTFGPLGSVQIAVEGSANSDGQGALTLRGNGNLGSFGARAGVIVYNAHPVAFDVRALNQTALPYYSAEYYSAEADDWALGLELSGTYRLSRRVLITASPTLVYLLDGGVGGRLQADITWRRALASDNVSLLFASETHPANSEGYVAFAGQYQLARRGLPLVTTALWLAVADGFTPGARVAVTARPGLLPLGYEITLAAEPFQLSTAAYRASLTSYLPLEAGTLELTAVTAWGEQADALELNQFNLSVGYALDF